MKVYLVWETAPSGHSYERSLVGIFKKKRDATKLAKKREHHGDPYDFTDCSIRTQVEEYEVRVEV